MGSGGAVNPNPWANENIPTDLITLFFHFLFWTILVLSIELGYLSFNRIKILIRHTEQRIATCIDLHNDRVLNNTN